MKLFVAVVMFVVFPVFAEDLPPGGGSQESSQTTKNGVTDNDKARDKTQGDQQNAGDMPVLKTEPQADSTYTPNQKREGSVAPKEKAEKWDFFRILWTVGSFVGFINIGVTIVLYILTQKRLKRRDVEDDKYRARTEQITLVTTRAHVELWGWKIDDLGDDEGRRWATVIIANKGKAPATIIGHMENYYLEKNRDVLPAPFDPTPETLDTSRTGGKLYAADPPTEWGVLIPPGTAFRKDIENHRVTLYALFYIAYDDGVGQEWEACSFVQYSLLFGWEFTPVGGPKYNYHRRREQKNKR